MHITFGPFIHCKHIDGFEITAAVNTVALDVSVQLCRRYNHCIAFLHMINLLELYFCFLRKLHEFPYC